MCEGDPPAALFLINHELVIKGLLCPRHEFAGKTQEAPQLDVGRNGKRGFGGGSPHYGFSLESPLDESGGDKLAK